MADQSSQRRELSNDDMIFPQQEKGVELEVIKEDPDISNGIKYKLVYSLCLI